MSDKDSQVQRICSTLDEHRSRDTVGLYIGDMCSFTDYFVISTANSEAHLEGLFHQLIDYLKSNGIDPLNSLKQSRDSGWILVDCGFVIVHLMTEEMRNFYELEKLWFHGEQVFGSSGSASGSAQSSSSSA
jgi:ribosome-associated protein